MTNQLLDIPFSRTVPILMATLAGSGLLVWANKCAGLLRSVF